MSEVETVAQTPEEVSSSLSAGFNKVRGEPSTESPLVIADETKQDAEPDKVEEVIPPKEEPIAGLGLTPSEVKAQLAGIGELRSSFEARERKLQGQMGSLKSEFMELVKAKPEPAPTLNATLKNLREAGYEDMAEILEKDIAELKAAPAATVDAEQIKALVQEQVNAAEAVRATRETEKEIGRIHKAYPSIATIAASDDFKIFKNLQPPEVQAAINSSNDYDFVTETLTGFTAWKKANDPTATKQKNTARLEAGLSPQGIPSNTPSVLPDSAGLSAGFNKVRRLG